MPNNACLALPKGSLNVLLTLSTAVKALKKQVEMIPAAVKKIKNEYLQNLIDSTTS